MGNMPTKQRITLAAIQAGPETQARASIDMGAVEEYSDAMKAGEEFPDITVYYDGTDYWLADGFHRVHAARHAGLNTINAMVHEGVARDALRWALSANARHGLKRTISDKLRCMELAFRDKEWQVYPSSELAKLCKLPVTFVIMHRDAIVAKAAGMPVRLNKPKKPKKKKEEEVEQDIETEAEPEVEPEAEATEERQPVILDEQNKQIPPELFPVFDCRSKYKVVAATLDSAIANIKLLADGPSGHYLAMHMQSIIAAIKNAKMNMLHTAPYAVVRREAGSPHPNWVSSDAWKALPERERTR
jgi:hypothetical protein